MNVLIAFILGLVIGGLGMFFYLYTKGKVANGGSGKVQSS